MEIFDHKFYTLVPFHCNVPYFCGHKYTSWHKRCKSIDRIDIAYQYGNTGCGVFNWGIQNQKDFWPENQHTQRKLLNFENWVNGEVSKVPKFDFQSQFCMSKIIRIFLNFFLLKNINLGAHFLLLTFFDNINFLITLLSKMMPNF